MTLLLLPIFQLDDIDQFLCQRLLPDKIGPKNDSLFGFAIRHGALKIMKHIGLTPKNVNYINDDNECYLTIAFKSGKYSIATWLNDVYGYDLKYHCTKSPLHLMLERGDIWNKNTKKWFQNALQMQRHPNFQNTSCHVLHYACCCNLALEMGDSNYVMNFEKKSHSFNVMVKYLELGFISFVIYLNSNVERLALKNLIKEKRLSDIVLDSQNLQPLANIACCENKLQALKWIETKYDLKQSITPIACAIKAGHVDLVIYLYMKYYQTSNQKRNFLLLASHNFPILKILLHQNEIQYANAFDLLTSISDYAIFVYVWNYLVLDLKTKALIFNFYIATHSIISSHLDFLINECKVLLLSLEMAIDFELQPLCLFLHSNELKTTPKIKFEFFKYLILNRNIKAIEWFAEYNDINEHINDGETILSFVVGDLEIFQKIFRFWNKRNPLFLQIAIINKEMILLQWLVENNSEVFQQLSSLSFASFHGYIYFLKWILFDKKIIFHHQSYYDAIETAIRANQLASIDLFLKMIKIEDNYMEKLIEIAIEHGKSELVEYFTTIVNDCIKIRHFECALKSNHLDIFKFLLKKYPSFTIDHKFLDISITYTNNRQIRYFIKRGCQTTVDAFSFTTEHILIDSLFIGRKKILKKIYPYVISKIIARYCLWNDWLDCKEAIIKKKS